MTVKFWRKFRVETFFAVVAGVVFSFGTAGAESDGFVASDLRWATIERTNKFRVNVIDEVSDGCWTSSAASKDKVELELIRSGAEIVSDEEAPFAPVINVHALGYATNDYSCAVIVRLDITSLVSSSYWIDQRKLDSIYFSDLWSTTSLLTGAKSDMSSRINEQHTNQIQKFLVDRAKNSNAVRKRMLESVSDDSKDFWEKHLNQ